MNRILRAAMFFDQIVRVLKDTRELITPAKSGSTFFSNGCLTAEEFVSSGDLLCLKNPTWQWKPSNRKYGVSHLPSEKQYLYCSGAACHERVSNLASCLTHKAVDDEEYDGLEGTVDTDLEWILTPSNSMQREPLVMIHREREEAEFKELNEVAFGIVEQSDADESHLSKEPRENSEKSETGCVVKSNEKVDKTEKSSSDDNYTTLADIPPRWTHDDDKDSVGVAPLNANDSTSQTSDPLKGSSETDMKHHQSLRRYNIYISYDKFYQVSHLLSPLYFLSAMTIITLTSPIFFCESLHYCCAGSSSMVVCLL